MGYVENVISFQLKMKSQTECLRGLGELHLGPSGRDLSDPLRTPVPPLGSGGLWPSCCHMTSAVSPADSQEQQSHQVDTKICFFNTLIIDPSSMSSNH